MWDLRPPAVGVFAVPRPAQRFAKLSGIFVSATERSEALASVPRTHDVTIEVRYLVPNDSLYNASVVLSFSSELASWRDILDLFRNHFALYHNIAVPDDSVVLILGNTIMAQRRDSSTLFFFDLMSSAYSARSEDTDHYLELFVTLVGVGRPHGMAIVRGEEKNIVPVPVTATVAELAEQVYRAGVEFFSPSANPANPNADRLVYLDRANTQEFPSNNGDTVVAAALDQLAISDDPTQIARFGIVYHTMRDALRVYYSNSAAYEPSYEDELHLSVRENRARRDYSLQQLQAHIEPWRRGPDAILEPSVADPTPPAQQPEEPERELIFDPQFLEY